MFNYRIPMCACSWLMTIFSSLCSVSFGDIIIDGYSAATNDRFSNNPSFIANSFNLSGVGQTSDGRWATAISNNVIISADHFRPSGDVFFYEGNNPGSAPVVRSIVADSGQKIAGTDLYVARLSSPLPGTIQFYSFATEPIAAPILPANTRDAGIYQGLNAYMFGLSPEARPANQDQAVGRNRITGYAENLNFESNTNADMLFLRQDAGAPDAVPFEGYVQTGDSGAPLFVDMGGQLRLLGINSANTRAPEASPPFLSLISYTGNQTASINTFIANAVPEPSSALLCLMVGMVAMAWRHPRGGLGSVGFRSELQ